MTRFLLFLRSLVWTSVFAAATALVSSLLALTFLNDYPDFAAITFGLVSISMALLSNVSRN